MGVLAAAIGVTAQLAHLLPGVQSDSVALRFQAHQARTPSNVVVVGIDDVTFSDLRRQWPFPRRMHARAIDRLKAAGAKTIVYDVQFTEPTTERDDTALYDAVARAGNVVLATSETDSKGRTNVLVGATSPSLQDVHATPAASHSVMSGAEIQANAIRTATRGLPLRTAPLWFDLLAIVLLALAPALAGLRARPLAIALVAPLVGIGWIALAQVAFGAGWIVAVVWPLAALLMGTTGTIA